MPKRKKRPKWFRFSSRRAGKNGKTHTFGGKVTTYIDPSVITDPAKRRAVEQKLEAKPSLGKPPEKKRLPGQLITGDEVTLVFVSRDGAKKEWRMKL